MPAMRAVHFLQTVVLLCAMCTTGVFAGVKLTVVPLTLDLDSPVQTNRTKGNLVTITCELTPETDDVMGTPDRLNIFRVLHGQSTESTIVLASNNTEDGRAHWWTRGRIQGAVLSGGLRQGLIVLTLTNPTCKDGGKYTCKAFFRVSNTTTKTKQLSQNLTVNVKPGKLKITASPQTSGRTVGDVLIMVCQGPLGTVPSGVKVDWKWEFREKHTRGKWASYNGSPDPVTDPLTDSPDKCYQQGRTVLTRRLSLADSGRVYRCCVRIPGMRDQIASDEYRVGPVNSSAGGADGLPEPSPHPSLVLGMGVGSVGVVVGLMVALAAGVGFALKRRRLLSFKNAEQTPSCPLLPTHRDPGWYGEYLEPVLCVPREEEEKSGIYTEIPNNYEDMDTTATWTKPVEATG